MQDLYCNQCKESMRLDYVILIYDIGGNQISVVDTVVLKCESCKKIFFPDLTKCALKALFTDLNFQVNINDFREIAQLSELELRSTPIPFKDLLTLDDKFIAQKVKFLYDRNDYYFIPGLLRESKTGFLTPVFLNIEVLIKYMYHPLYQLDLRARSLGSIRNINGEELISFGINKNKKIIMWLGDIMELDVNEQFYLRSENVASDHDIGCDFYNAQIECVWAKPSVERKVISSRYEFNKLVNKHLGVSISQLDQEILDRSAKIRKLILEDKDEFFNQMAALSAILVESINVKSIKNHLIFANLANKEDIENKGGIKILELFLAKYTTDVNISEVISPLYVLYDLRICASHLLSSEKLEEKFNYCLSRLELDKENFTYTSISTVIFEKLEKMYVIFSDAIRVEVLN